MEKKQVSLDAGHILAAFATYLLGWIYVDAFMYGERIWTVIFTAVFSLTAMMVHRQKLRGGEHWIWLGCLWLCLICWLVKPGRVWPEYMTWLFLHGFAAYWVLCLAGMQMEGKSGAYVALDGLFALMLYPMMYLCTFLRTRVLFEGVRKLNPRKCSLSTLGYSAAAVVVGGILLVNVGGQLMQADADFGAFLLNLVPRLNADLSWNVQRFVFISLPVGGYLYGLIVGTARTNRDMPDSLVRSLNDARGGLQKVPNMAWAMVVGCFAAMYLLFFGFQSSYLFGAFSRSLPDGFTVAEYARQGFFELCRCMGLNFCLLWLVMRTCRLPLREDRLTRGLCGFLLVLSLLLSVTAMSKLMLYIDCFGFTARRLQSFWGVSVLAAGCVCSLVWLWTGKRTDRFWVCFCGVTLALLHLF